MGIRMIGSGGSNTSYGNKNPDPRRFKIEKMIELENTYVEVNYPDAQNYEGNKVLVYRGKVANEIMSAKVLDPHFTESGLSPIARFKPDFYGKWLGMQIAKGIQDE